MAEGAWLIGADHRSMIAGRSSDLSMVHEAEENGGSEWNIAAFAVRRGKST